MTPVSVPANPPQPAQPSYDASKLETVQEYTAESYQAAWGVSPPYNPALPIKTWFDSTAAGLPQWSFVTYQAVQQIEGIYKMAPFSLPASVAAVINIPPGWPMVPSPAPITPVPQRALLPNEALSPVFGVFSQAIVRTDLPQSGMNQTAPPDDPTLAKILTVLEALALKAGVTVALLLLIFAGSLRAQFATVPPRYANPSPIAGPPQPAATVAPVASASVVLPTEGVALGGAYAPSGTPNVAGWFSQWNQISAGLYNYNSFDVTSLKQSPFTAQQSARAGLAYFLKQIGPFELFGLGDAGVATAATTSGTNIGSAFSGGGGLILPLGKMDNYGVIFCVRVLKTALSNSQNIFELGFAWGK